MIGQGQILKEYVTIFNPITELDVITNFDLITKFREVSIEYCNGCG